MYAEGVKRIERTIESPHGDFGIAPVHHDLVWWNNVIIHWHAVSWVLTNADGRFIAHFKMKKRNVQETVEAQCNS